MKAMNASCLNSSTQIFPPCPHHHTHQTSQTDHTSPVTNTHLPLLMFTTTQCPTS